MLEKTYFSENILQFASSAVRAVFTLPYGNEPLRRLQSLNLRQAFRLKHVG